MTSNSLRPVHVIRWAFEADTASCHLCGRRIGQRVFGKERFLNTGQTLRRCSSCAGVYLAPDFTDHSLDEFYSSEYRNLYTIEKSRVYDAQFFKLRLFREYALARVAYVSKLIPECGTVFEHGSGFGAFLGVLAAKRPDVRLFAAELDMKNRQHLLDGADVNFIEIDKLVAEGPYDLIAAFHTLEHLKDPVQFLRQARKALKLEGYLVIEVPNILSDWRNWKFVHPAHLSYFSCKSLERLITRCGLLPMKVCPHPGGPAFSGMLLAVARPLNEKEPLPVVEPASEEEISQLDSHIESYRWRLKDSVKDFIKSTAVKFLGTERVGAWQRKRFYHHYNRLL